MGRRRLNPPCLRWIHDIVVLIYIFFHFYNQTSEVVWKLINTHKFYLNQQSLPNCCTADKIIILWSLHRLAKWTKIQVHERSCAVRSAILTFKMSDQRESYGKPFGTAYETLSLILLCCWPLFGYECIGSCENKRAEPGRSEFVWMSLPVSLTSMSKISRITSKLRQVIIWTLRMRLCSKLWCFSS